MGLPPLSLVCSISCLSPYTPNPFPLPITPKTRPFTFMPPFLMSYSPMAWKLPFSVFSLIANKKTVCLAPPPSHCWSPLRLCLSYYLHSSKRQSLLLWGWAAYHFTLLLGVLLCDTLVVIPFAHLRAIRERQTDLPPLKLLNVGLYTGLQPCVFVVDSSHGIKAIFTMTTLCNMYLSPTFGERSRFVLLCVMPFYFRLRLAMEQFRCKRQMLRYGAPIMIRGLGFCGQWKSRQTTDSDTISTTRQWGPIAGAINWRCLWLYLYRHFALGAEPFFLQIR